MTTLARFFNLADAELLKTRLEANGVPVFLADEASFTAGYGPVTGGLRVQVNETDVARARELLTQAPAIELPDDFEIEGGVPAPEPQRKTPLLPIALGLALLGTLMVILVKNRAVPQPAPGQDYEEDRNGDGRSDGFFRYEKGVPVAAREDVNFDGQIDCWFIIKNGAYHAAEYDTDFNGAPDMFSTFTHGIVSQTDVRPNGSPIATRRFVYRAGVLREEFVDDDEDGKFDRKIEYDSFLKPTATIDLK
jgi:hypothetical protein